MANILLMPLFWVFMPVVLEPFREVATPDQTIKNSEWSGCFDYLVVFFLKIIFVNDQHSIVISFEWLIPCSFCIPKINLLSFSPPSDLPMKFYWYQLCFIAFSALLATVPIDDTNWFHCHALAIPSLGLIAAFPIALSVFGYTILYTLNQKNSAGGTLRVVRGRKMVFSRPTRGEMVPTSSWAAILPVLPHRESQLCVCPEDLLAVALSLVLPWPPHFRLPKPLHILCHLEDVFPSSWWCISVAVTKHTSCPHAPIQEHYRKSPIKKKKNYQAN